MPLRRVRGVSTLAAHATSSGRRCVLHWIDDPRVKRRSIGETGHADVKHGDRVWTYRLARAYVSEFGLSGGRFQLLEPFDVGVLPD